jgi:hypothetical protein
MLFTVGAESCDDRAVVHVTCAVGDSSAQGTTEGEAAPRG